MKFPYRPSIWFDAATQGFDFVLRPMIQIRVRGQTRSATYWALVDTGADQVVFPASLARDLNISLDSTLTGRGNSFGGGALNFILGQVELEIRHSESTVKFQTEVGFMEFDSPDDEVLILGQAGFLAYFTATFDGEDAVLTLSPNSKLPKAVAN